MNLDYERVCSKHKSVFEAYYNQIDPKGSGAIEAMIAAKFLKKSGLSDVVLSRIWDLSDPNGKGFLDQKSFFIALKLVSLAQAGQVINMTNIYTETPNPPKLGDLPKIMPPRISNVPSHGGGVIAPGAWSISVIDRLKYEQLFESLNPVGGMLPGTKVRNVLIDSKLPMDLLGKIWDLADQDKDGNLDKHEFIVAMHLVYQTLNKRTVPDILPPELRKPSGSGMPPPKPAPPQAAMPRAPSGDGFSDASFVANFPKDIAPPPALPPLPVATRVPPIGAANVTSLTEDPLIPIGAPPSVTANADWVVNVPELKRYEILFRDSDRDKDGLVSGLEVKGVFLQSGVPQQCLAHIWALCDTNQSGKLTLEQFALAMWMVERKQKGIEPPQVLTANMVPPSMRAHVAGVDVQSQAEPKPAYSNPELEMISKEIEELAKERRIMETEIAQKEADIRIKAGEVRSLQSELDTLSATLKQLENQRGEAQKRLDDLKAQVTKIRDQSQKQEETINEQEGELNAKRSELQKLKDEEAALQKEYDENNRELQKLTQHLQNTQLQISSVRSMVTQLLEAQRQMTDALLMCRAAIENQDPDLCTEYQLKIEPDLDEARHTLEKKLNDASANKVDPFGGDAFGALPKASNGFVSSNATNGFGSSSNNNDPFAANSSNIRAVGGFDDSFNAASAFDSGFDTFGNSSSAAFGQQQHRDPFGGTTDAFGASAMANKAVTPDPSKDDFGSDPFAALHAPTGQGQVLSPNAQRGPPPRPESPSPALPPKKSKVPPPRPAPPRPTQAPGRNTQPTMDAFGSATSSGGGTFADFADFDNKSPIIPTPTFPLFATNEPKLSPTPTTTTSSLLNSSLFDNNFTQLSSSSSVSPMFASISTVAPTLATTTSTTTITGSNSNITRSITPLQQAASDIFSTLTKTATAPNQTTSAINGPTDFSDDPFKDYRYEDPFNIKDPFADAENDTDFFSADDSLTKAAGTAVQVIKSDLSSDSDYDDAIQSNTKVIAESSLKSDSNSSAAFSSSSMSQKLAISNEILDKFDAFNINAQLPELPQNLTAGIINNNNNNDAKKSSPVPAAVVASLFDNFADFDAFSSHSSTSASSTTQGGATKKPNHMAKQNIDSFFDAFNDNFETTTNHITNSDSGGTVQPNAITTDDIFSAFGENKNSMNAFEAAGGNNNKFDAFYAADINTNTKGAHNAVTKSAKLFDDSFDNDFFKTQTVDFGFNNTKNTNKNNDNTAKFDAFADKSSDFIANFSPTLNNANNAVDSSFDVVDSAMGGGTTVTMQNLIKVQNQTMLTKTPNNQATAKSIENGAGGKFAEKFETDYSRPETFDHDLQEALQRSMREQ